MTSPRLTGAPRPAPLDAPAHKHEARHDGPPPPDPAPPHNAALVYHRQQPARAAEHVVPSGAHGDDRAAAAGAALIPQRALAQPRVNTTHASVGTSAAEECIAGAGAGARLGRAGGVLCGGGPEGAGDHDAGGDGRVLA